MEYTLKKEHLTNWNVADYQHRSNLFDDYDSPISERTSIDSSLDTQVTRTSLEETKSSITERKPKKEPHTLRYPYNDLSQTGVALAEQYKLRKEQEKTIKQDIRKALPGQGKLAAVPSSQSNNLGENHYPYWHYYKMKNPDWSMRHRQTADGQLIPYDRFNPSQYVQEPASNVSSNKVRNTRRDRPMRYNSAVKTNEFIAKSVANRNSDDTTYIPLNDLDNHSHDHDSLARSRNQHKIEQNLTSNRSMTGKIARVISMTHIFQLVSRLYRSIDR
jgi:hypothetical protein